MAILQVRTFPEPILSQNAKPVAGVTTELIQLAHDMLETMYAAPGIGLAAPQVGQSLQLIVLDIRTRDDDGNLDETEMTEAEKKTKFPLIMFNPKILSSKGNTTFEEGCLSVPGYVEEVRRAQFVDVKYLDEAGKEQKLSADGLLAICIQHEIDHLEGTLFIDRLSSVKRNLIKSKIKKNGYPEQDRRHIL